MHPSFQKTTTVGRTTRFLKVALVVMGSLYIVVYCKVSANSCAPDNMRYFEEDRLSC
jgi:hypothetical protein